MPWSTLAQFLGSVYDNHLAQYAAKRTLFEPRRIATPDGYHSTKCVAAGLYALLTQANLAAEDGAPLPTEVTGSTFCYRILEHQVPIYFVDEEFARAVAATQLPDDFTFGDLHWPLDGMVVGWPSKFLRPVYRPGDWLCPRGQLPCWQLRSARRASANAGDRRAGGPQQDRLVLSRLGKRQAGMLRIRLLDKRQAGRVRSPPTPTPILWVRKRPKFKRTKN